MSYQKLRRAQYWPAFQMSDGTDTSEKTFMTVSMMDTLVPWKKYAKKDNSLLQNGGETISAKIQYIYNAKYLKLIPIICCLVLTGMFLLSLYAPGHWFERKPEIKKTYETVIGVLLIAAVFIPCIIAGIFNYNNAVLKRKRLLDHELQQTVSAEVLKKYFDASEIYTDKNCKPQQSVSQFFKFLRYGNPQNPSKIGNLKEILSFKGNLRNGATFTYHDIKYIWRRHKSYEIESVKAFVFNLKEKIDPFFIDLPASQFVVQLDQRNRKLDFINKKLFGNPIMVLDNIYHTYYDNVSVMRFKANEPNVECDMVLKNTRITRYSLFMQQLDRSNGLYIPGASIDNKSNLLCDIRGGYGIPNKKFQACLKRIKEECGCYCSILGDGYQFIVLFYDPTYLFLSDLAIDAFFDQSVPPDAAKKMQNRWVAQAEWIHHMFEPMSEFVQ